MSVDEFENKEGRSSLGMWKSLFELLPWKEFKDTMQARLVITRDQLELEEDDAERLRLQGDARTLRFILEFEAIIEKEFEERKEISDGE